MEAVGVCDTVYGCVERGEEGQDVRDEACSAGDARGHVACAHHFHHKHQWQDCQEIVVCAEGCQPVYGDVVDPDDEHWHVYWEDPEHEDEDGGRVVVEVVVCARACVASEAEGPYTSA